MKKNYLICLLLLGVLAAYSQGTLIPAGNPAYHIVDRMAIKSGIEAPIHLGLRYYRRGDLAAYAARLDSASSNLSARDREDLQYLFDDNHEWIGQADDPTTLTGRRNADQVKVYVDSTHTFYYFDESKARKTDTRAHFRVNRKPILGTFYRTSSALYEVNKPGFNLIINPLLDFNVAYDQFDNSNQTSNILFLNKRGIEIRGSIDDRIYFETNVTDAQARLPNYVRRQVIRDEALPGNGSYKPYKSSIFDVTGAYDFLNAQGLIGFNVTRHVGVQFGHGRNFIGNGYRSMFMSDYANNALFLRMNARIWRLHYQTIIAELAASTPREQTGSGVLPKKFMAAHYLSFKAAPRLNFGIFEAVMFQREGFELQYLNPIIFYRTIESMLGSGDNVLLGGDMRWDFAQHFSLYGQLLLDEFKFSHIKARDGWWGNKYALQAGVQYIDAFGLDHLDLRAEFNQATPYTYSHFDSLANYTHTKQALAHPLGANFREFLAIAHYAPTRKWLVEGRLMYAITGDDADTSQNWGGNILLNYKTRENDLGNFIGQGNRATTLLGGLDVSYMFYHNMYADLHFFYRNKASELDQFDLKNMYVGAGIRVNMWPWRLDF